jgi:hypothetical protein
VLHLQLLMMRCMVKAAAFLEIAVPAVQREQQHTSAGLIALA